MLEDDFYRYLWDGGVTAHGFNPYAYAPADVLREGSAGTHPLGALADDAGAVLERVNHPHLRTIYPPVAQAAFALAHVIGPWSLTAWRVVLAAFDGAVLIMLAALLRRLDLPPVWIVLYWWNPLVVKEVFNAAHMDVMTVPFVLGAVWCAVARRYVGAAALLALAAGCKVWPVLLLPVILRPLMAWRRRSILQLGAALAVFALLTAAMAVPVYASRLDATSGFVAYGRRWEMNDALYMLFVWAVRYLPPLAGGAAYGHQAARLCAGAVLLAWTIWVVRRPPARREELFGQALAVAAAAFLLSPTQFPWYYLWVLPFLVLRPRLSLLLLTALLPLYYLRFHCQALELAGAATGAVWFFDYGIVWLEYLPVLALLAVEWWRGPVPQRYR
jgi:hypothetical protein